jgi:hypothetical protein
MRSSVGNWSFPCQSHYWIPAGNVVWAPKWSAAQVEAGRQRTLTERGAVEEVEPVPDAPRPVWRRILGAIGEALRLTRRVRRRVGVSSVANDRWNMRGDGSAGVRVSRGEPCAWSTALRGGGSESAREPESNGESNGPGQSDPAVNPAGRTSKLNGTVPDGGEPSGTTAEGVGFGIRAGRRRCRQQRWQQPGSAAMCRFEPRRHPRHEVGHNWDVGSHRWAERHGTATSGVEFYGQRPCASSPATSARRPAAASSSATRSHHRRRPIPAR